MQHLVANSVPCDSVNRGSLSTDQGRYDGIQYTNSFMPSKDIHVIGATFFGPKTDVGLLTVFVTLMESQKVYHHNVQVFLEERIQVQVKKDEKFFVEFSSPVCVRKNTWTDFSFQIESIGEKPATFGKLNLKDLNNMSPLSKSGSVEFQFLRGSRQMPDIHFILP